MRVRPDQDRVADPQRVLGTSAEHGVLHDQDVGADLDRAGVPGHHGAGQDPAPGAERDVPGDHGRGSDPGVWVDPWHPVNLSPVRRTLRA